MSLSKDSSLVRPDLEYHATQLGQHISESIIDETHLVGSIAVSHHSVCADDDTVNLLVLHQRTKHGITCTSKGSLYQPLSVNMWQNFLTDHAGGNLQGGELERGQTGTWSNQN